MLLGKKGDITSMGRCILSVGICPCDEREVPGMLTSYRNVDTRCVELFMLMILRNPMSLV